MSEEPKPLTDEELMLYELHGLIRVDSGHPAHEEAGVVIRRLAAEVRRLRNLVKRGSAA